MTKYHKRKPGVVVVDSSVFPLVAFPRIQMKSIGINRGEPYDSIELYNSVAPGTKT